MNKWEIDKALPEEYLAYKLDEEDRLLRSADESLPGVQYYGTHRDEIAYFAVSYIQELVLNRSHLHIIEIGAGQGKAIEALNGLLKDRHHGAQCEMTTLIKLPFHQQLEDRGIIVHDRILAEHMPEEWNRKYDIVLTQCVLAWTQMEKSIPNIKRIIRPDGYWIGYESAGYHYQTSNWEIGDAAEYFMRLNGMRNQMSPLNVMKHRSETDYFPIVYKKT